MGKVIVTILFVCFTTLVFAQTYQGSFTQKSVILNAESEYTRICNKRQKTRSVECTFKFDVQSDLLEIMSPVRNNTVKMRKFRVAETQGGIKQYFAQDVNCPTEKRRDCFIFIKGSEIVQIQYWCNPANFFVIYHN